MSLDALKGTYLPDRLPKYTKTSYSKMHDWIALKSRENYGSPMTQNQRNRKQMEMLYSQEKHMKDEMRRIQTERNYFPHKVDSQSSSMHSSRLLSRAYNMPNTGGEYGNGRMPVSLGHVGKFTMPSMTSRPVHLQYYKSGGYDDWHKANLNYNPRDHTDPLHGPQKLRNGRMGGTWRHVKEVLQSGGSRIVFVDGTTCIDDKSRQKTFDFVDHAPDVRQRNSSDIARELLQLQKSRPLNTTSYWNGGAIKATEKGNWSLIR